MAGAAQGGFAGNETDRGPSGRRANWRDRSVRRHPVGGAVPWAGSEPDQPARRGRDRARDHRLCAHVEWWPDRDGKRFIGGSSQTAHWLGGPAQAARPLFPNSVRRRRRPALLWTQHHRAMAARRRLCRSYSQRRKACRSAGAGADQVRAGDQSQDRKGARPRHSRDRARARRRGNRMKRREFITLLGGTAAASIARPLAVRAQQPERLRRVGVLVPATADDAEYRARLGGFLQKMGELGWTDGRNMRIEYRWTFGVAEDSRRYAAEMVALAPDVILANGGQILDPLRQMTRALPIVFVAIVDPVGAGYVASLSRPGGNITGFTNFEYSLTAKWLELLKEIAPGVARAAVLRDPSVASGSGQFGVIQAMATLLELIIRRVARLRLPAIYPFGYFVHHRGLISNGPDIIDQYRRAAGYVD